MKLKLDENGNAVLKDGKPVYIAENGTEHVFDAPALVGQVNELTTQNTSLKAIADKVGDLDIDKAKKAMKTLAELDENSGQKEVAELVKEAQRQKDEEWTQKYTEIEGKYNSLHGNFVEEKMTSAFATSEFIKNNSIIPPSLVRKLIGDSFKVEEDGKVYAYDEAGNKMLSKVKAGEYASVDEAVENMIKSSPYKDSILKGSQADGGGFNGEQGNNSAAGAKSSYAACTTEAEKIAFLNQIGSHD